MCVRVTVCPPFPPSVGIYWGVSTYLCYTTMRSVNAVRKLA
uniref:Uncharacterized protein n=1 Tax=Anguilla anguilla TaxID=7936 RepID=A0A0E9TZ52_ANGAN